MSLSTSLSMSLSMSLKHVAPSCRLPPRWGGPPPQRHPLRVSAHATPDLQPMPLALSGSVAQRCSMTAPTRMGQAMNHLSQVLTTIGPQGIAFHLVPPPGLIRNPQPIMPGRAATPRGQGASSPTAVGVKADVPGMAQADLPSCWSLSTSRGTSLSTRQSVNRCWHNRY